MNIQPVSIWANGQSSQATNFILTCIYDNLSNEATFYYQLQNVDNVKLADGNLVMNGTDYENWNTTTDINLAAYQWAATELNITLL